jgi:hypothetical protein
VRKLKLLRNGEMERVAEAVISYKFWGFIKRLNSDIAKGVALENEEAELADRRLL